MRRKEKKSSWHVLTMFNRTTLVVYCMNGRKGGNSSVVTGKFKSDKYMNTRKVYEIFFREMNFHRLIPERTVLRGTWQLRCHWV